MRILVVDDVPDTADMLEMLLRAAGHDVRTALRGSAALEIAQTFLPELAILDIQLPDINGHRVAKELRKNFGRRVYIVAITGGDASQLPFASNFDQHALKPVSAAHLYQLIDVAHEALRTA